MVAFALPNNFQGPVKFFHKKAFWNTWKNVTLRLTLWSLNFVRPVWMKSSIFIQFLMQFQFYSCKQVFQLPHFIKITSIACSRPQNGNVCAQIVKNAWGLGREGNPTPFNARSHPSCFSLLLISWCPYYLRGWHRLDNQEHSRSISCLPRIINFVTAVSLQCSMKT